MGHYKDATPNQTLTRQRRVTRHCQTRPWCGANNCGSLTWDALGLQ